MTQPYAIYRHHAADGSLLYVGISANPKRRLAEHKCRSVWSAEIATVAVAWLPDRLSAEIAEREAIQSERPVFNGGHSKAVPTGDAMRDWMRTSGMTQTAIAQEFGCARSLVCQWISGTRRTPLNFAAFIEGKSGGDVPIRYWLFGETVARNLSVIEGGLSA